MRHSVMLMVGALVGVVGVAPAAYAKRRHHHVVAAVAAVSPRMNANGDFYATPMSATGMGVGSPLLALPGMNLAGGIANGALQIPGIGVNAAGNVLNGLTSPLLAPAPAS